MSQALSDVYAELGPFLFGEQDAEALERKLGSSPSGPDKLDFYRILIARNANKIMTDLFPTIHGLVVREHPGLWPDLVRAYARAHPTDARDPNRFGLAFSDFLTAHREAGGPLSTLFEELADYQMCRYLAATAADLPAEDDGFETRLFVRGYTHRVAEIVKLLDRDRAAVLPDPRPTTLIIYRSVLPPSSMVASGLATHTPGLEEVAALAHRQGLSLPPPLSSVGPEGLARGLASLLRRGIFGERDAG